MSEEDQIRRLLADAKHTEPIPPDVAGRMDGVIADLRADRPVRPIVTDLAAARRRRRVRTLLVAAAAVVVAGIGVDQIRGIELGGQADSTSSGDSNDRGAESATRPQPAAGELDRTTQELDFSYDLAIPIDPDRFGRQVARLRPDGDTAASALPQDGAELNDLPGQLRCAAPGRGRAVEVLYDGSPGLLLYRPPRGDSQVVELYLCGGDEPTRSITLPAR